MKTTALTALIILLACAFARADDTAGTSETQILGMREQMFRDVGPRRSVLAGLEVYPGKLFGFDMLVGVRPIFLDAQGREQLGAMHGKDGGSGPVRVKAKRGYAVGAISVRRGLGVDGLSVTFMKLVKGRLDPDQSYDSDWIGGRGGSGPIRLGGGGDPVVGVIGSQNNNSQLNGLGLVLSDKPLVDASQRKQPVPDDDATSKALKLAKEVYGTDWAAAKTAGQKKELAQKLLHAADESEGDLPGRYVLLKLARDIATQATDGLAAFEAIDKMAEQFAIDDVEMKTNVLASFSKRAKLTADHKGIADQAAGLIDGAIAHDNIDLAIKLCELALPEARAARDADLLKEVQARSDKCKTLRKAYREMQEAAAVLEKTPDDAAANLAVGKFYCFQKGDWEKGLPMLALGKDDVLKAVATQEIAGPTKADAQVAVGDAWWNLAEKEQGKLQGALRGRAIYWYEQALPELSGLAKARLEKRVKAYEAVSEKAEEKAENTPAAKLAGKFLPGLVGHYFSDSVFGQPATNRIDTEIDFNWGFNAPDGRMPVQNYSIRWFGYVKAPKAGRYLFRVHGHFDSKLMIDKQLLINNEVVSFRISDQVGEIVLSAGFHPLVMQFVHGTGNANISLRWQPPGEATVTTIPADSLFHDQRQEKAAGIK